jgi:hypothetical protein
VLDDFLEPVDADNFSVSVSKIEDPDFEDQELDLRPTLGSKGFFQGYYLPPAPGEYEIFATGTDQEMANKIRFTVYDESLELRRPGMRLDVAEQIAMKSSGKVIRLEDIDSVSKKVEESRPKTVHEVSFRLWDHPLLYLLLLFVAGGEWWQRRKLRLV